MTWGQLIEAMTCPTHDLVMEELARQTPSDHEAVVAGHLWIGWLTSGQKAGMRTFIPSPQAVATQLSGKVVHVWP
jgi:hypothetical protein